MFVLLILKVCKIFIRSIFFSITSFCTKLSIISCFTYRIINITDLLFDYLYRKKVKYENNFILFNGVISLVSCSNYDYQSI